MPLPGGRTPKRISEAYPRRRNMASAARDSIRHVDRKGHRRATAATAHVRRCTGDADSIAGLTAADTRGSIECPPQNREMHSRESEPHRDEQHRRFNDERSIGCAERAISMQGLHHGVSATLRRVYSRDGRDLRRLPLRRSPDRPALVARMSETLAHDGRDGPAWPLRVPPRSAAGFCAPLPSRPLQRNPFAALGNTHRVRRPPRQSRRSD